MNDSSANARSREWIVPLLAAAGAMLYAWMCWCAFSSVTWNDLRVAPAFALRHGWPLYPPLGGGPLTTWIYGPVGVLVNLPATFAHSTVGALQVAGVINFLTLAAPFTFIFLNSSELRRAGRSSVVLALGLGGLLLPSYTLVYQVPDHTATALGLLACWCLAKPASPAPSHTFLAALLCVGAIGAKQTAIFLIPALAVFLWKNSPRTSLRFLAWTAVLGALALASAVAKFGADELWLNLVTIPGHLPWSSFSAKIVPKLGQVLAWVALPWALLGVFWARGGVSARTTATGRLLRCATLVALAGLPIGLAGLYKIGGEIHLVNSAAYLFPALVLAWCAHQTPSPSRGLIAVGVALALHAPEFATLPLRPDTARLELGDQLAQANPGTLWFPQDPLITYFSDKKFYHAEDGIVTRDLAGLGMRAPDFHRHLPANLRAVVYPVGTRDTISLQLIPEFKIRVKRGPWEIYQRPATP